MSGPLLGLPAAVADLTDICKDIWRSMGRRGSKTQWSTTAEFNLWTPDYSVFTNVTTETAVAGYSVGTGEVTISPSSWYVSATGPAPAERAIVTDAQYDLTNIDVIRTIGSYTGPANVDARTALVVSANKTASVDDYDARKEGSQGAALGDFDVSAVVGAKYIRLHAKSRSTVAVSSSITATSIYLLTINHKVASDKIVIADGRTEFTLLSPVVAKTTAWNGWDVVTFTRNTPGTSTMRIDLCDGATGAVLIEGLTNLHDISHITAESLRLRAIGARDTAEDDTPELLMASIGWRE